MAKKKKCPHFSSRQAGRWMKLVCTLPAGQACPNPSCQANPDRQEPDKHDEE